jgi:hypothetical protein
LSPALPLQVLKVAWQRAGEVQPTTGKEHVDTVVLHFHEEGQEGGAVAARVGQGAVRRRQGQVADAGAASEAGAPDLARAVAMDNPDRAEVGTAAAVAAAGRGRWWWWSRLAAVGQLGADSGSQARGQLHLA